MATASATNVGQARAVALLQACGRKNADSFEPEKLVTALKKLVGKLESGESEEPELSQDNKDTLDLVKSAIAAEDEIVIKVGKAKKDKAGKGKSEDSEKKRKPPTMPKDDFGCKPTGDGGRINAALKTSPQAIKKIADKAQVTEGRVKDHCTFLIKRGGSYEGAKKKIRTNEGKTEFWYEDA